ncbi:AAA domain-containing protein [Sphingomonas sp. HF-S3]|uniref:AAA domain-containing protein n=1 Tax=Sphingomonas rustica TaxID=3103142 RepID=A0ABV0BCU6_9SPHN
MNISRPYADLGIDQLEKLVSDVSGSHPINDQILAELRYRNTQRALRLRGKLEKMLSGPDGRAEAQVPNPKPVSQSQSPSRATSSPRRPLSLPPRSSDPNDPQNILRAWTVLEVLSPASFKTPADLAAGDGRRVARFEKGLPWAGGAAKSPHNTRLFFQIVLGSLAMQPAMEHLLQRFADNRPERPSRRGETPLAVVIVDCEGRPIPDSCAVISSFAWGLPLALTDDPATLSEWQALGEGLQDTLHDQLFREGPDGRPKPLDMAAITNAHQWLVDELGVDRTMVRPPIFAVRSLVAFKSKSPPEPLLLNSFFLKDLHAATLLFRDKQAPPALQRFIGARAPSSRRDLLNDGTAIEQVVAPARFPPARWPGPGRHPLVLMQQAAVNLAVEQSDGEILAVNGPPGTGKTTLLRDVVAALVTQRASAMAALDDPEKAFSPSGHKLKAGNGWLQLYGLDKALKGFEMLIASSNNKAVENVSAELPALGAVADDAPDLRYFKPLADGLLGAESWGAIAAVLGNGANRGAFKDKFWWDPDTGLFNYLKAVDGRKPEVEQPDGSKRPPTIVTELNPPVERREALRRWQAARSRFRLLEKQVTETTAAVEAFRRRWCHLPAIERSFNAARDHAKRRPGWVQQLFRLADYRRWKSEHLPLSSALATDAAAASDARVISKAVAGLLTRSPWLGFGAASRAMSIEQGLRPLLEQLRHDREARQAPIIDDAFFDQENDQRQPTAPWLSAEEHRQRDALFQAALDLHRAFIDAAAKPLRHNLNAMLQVLDGKGFSDQIKDVMIPDLWSSLFLVVPAVSTTFASVGTMLARVPAEALGWLLVDEAGQAAPQQAVGAIMRANRAIVVGDPVQVQPVVLLPDRLTAAICQTFNVDPQRFGAPTASVQTLADDATAWFAEFPARIGSRTVGVPLLVHRRCSSPMFDIANRIAYENLMVQAKADRPSAIRDLIGPSRWIDVTGSGEDKWCLREGQEALAMMEQVVSAGIKPDLYIVTPFVIVANGLRRLFRDSAVLAHAIPELDHWTRAHIGTIHTVQGREAEAVIFVLGAPNEDQTGARAWAGKDPNLLNVAVTRAKEAVYVIGNKALWRSAGVFSDLNSVMH